MINLLVVYIWLAVHRPFEFLEFTANWHIEMVLVVLMGLAWLAHQGKGSPASLSSAGFLSLLMAMVFCWMMSSYREVAEQPFELLKPAIVFFFLFIMSVSTEIELRKLTAAFVIGTGLYIAHSSFEFFFRGRHEFRMGIRRMMGVDLTWGNPNAFAATAVLILPFAFMLWPYAKGLARRSLLLGFLLLCVLAVVNTGSRSGMVAMVVAAGLQALSIKKYRMRMILLMLLAAVVTWVLSPESMQNRFLTLINPEYGPSNANTSAKFRTLAFQLALEKFPESPLVGFGPGSFIEASGLEHQAHNLYAQILFELGLVGVFSFLLIIFGFYWNSRQIRRLAKPFPFDASMLYFRRLNFAIIVGVLLLLLKGWGGHNLYRYNWFWFAAFQVVTLRLARRRADELQSMYLESAAYYSPQVPEFAIH